MAGVTLTQISSNSDVFDFGNIGGAIDEIIGYKSGNNDIRAFSEAARDNSKLYNGMYRNESYVGAKKEKERYLAKMKNEDFNRLLTKIKFASKEKNKEYLRKYIKSEMKIVPKKTLFLKKKKVRREKRLKKRAEDYHQRKIHKSKIEKRKK